MGGLAAVIGDGLGLIGSVLLVVPALKAGRYLGTLASVRRAADSGEQTPHDPGEALVKLMENNRDRWRPGDQRMLKGGIWLLVASYGLSLLASWPQPG